MRQASVIPSSLWADEMGLEDYREELDQILGKTS